MPQHSPAPGEAADLAALLLCRADRSALVQVRGDSMRDAGIRHGDLLLVRRRRRAAAGQVVVAQLRGGLTLKRLVHRTGRWWLEAAHPDYPPLLLRPGRLWGVAVQRIRRLDAGSGERLR